MSLMTNSPKEYPDFMTYEGNKESIIKYWSKARPELRKDVGKIAFIEENLEKMFRAFESDDVAEGCNIAIELYNMELRKLR